MENNDLVTSCCTLNEPKACTTFACATRMLDVDPASQYIKLKLIQNTVRVPASLRTSDLAALTVYQPALKENAYVNWNVMSDRPIRSIQSNLVVGGSFYHGSSTKRTITRCRPNAGCPGGAGVDIKHKSYDRYLLQLKGKGPVRQGVVPPDFGKPIVFDPAHPVYGGKTMKTSIVGNNCTCPLVPNKEQEDQIYRLLVPPVSFSMIFQFRIGDVVYATTSYGNNAIGIIINIDDDIYTVLFDDETTVRTPADCIFLYFPCKCNQEQILENQITLTGKTYYSDPPHPSAVTCFIINQYFGAEGNQNIIRSLSNLLPAEYQQFISTYYA